MTYAKFGALAKRHPSLGQNLEIILCDEIHNLIRFEHFKDEGEQRCLEYARDRLEALAKHSAGNGPLLIGISATPDAAVRGLNCPLNHIPVDSDIFHYCEERRADYRNVWQLLSEWRPGVRGIVYMQKIEQLKKCEALLKDTGIPCVSIWSAKNETNPMTEEQLYARQYIIEHEAIPPQYDVLLINASSETSINIRGEVQAMVIHSQENDVRTQVRGRYRGNLPLLYTYNTDAALDVPEEFLNRPLFTKDKRALCEILNIRDSAGRCYGWTTVRGRLKEQGYSLESGRKGNLRYDIIVF